MRELLRSATSTGLDPHLIPATAWVVAVACCAGTLIFVLTRERRFTWDAETGEATPATWNVRDVLIVGLLGMALSSIVVCIDALVSSWSRGQTDLSGWVLLRGLLIQNVVLVGIALLWIGRRYGQGLKDLGLRAANWKGEALLGVVLGAFLFLSALAAQQLTEWLVASFSSESRAAQFMERHGTAEMIGGVMEGLPAWGVAVAMLAVVILVPVAEELLFRGFAYAALKRRYGVGMGLFLSALLFALLHFSEADLLALLLVGAVLSWVYDRRRSLVAPIVAHALNNLVSVGLLMAGRG